MVFRGRYIDIFDPSLIIAPFLATGFSQHPQTFGDLQATVIVWNYNCKGQVFWVSKISKYKPYEREAAAGLQKNYEGVVKLCFVLEKNTWQNARLIKEVNF